MGRAKTFLLTTYLLHLTFLLLILFPPSFLQKKKERKPLIVKTVSLHKRKLPATTASRTTPIPKPAPQVKKESAAIPKPAPIKKAPPIADKVIKKAAPLPKPRGTISDALVKELQESIANIDKTPAKKTAPSKPSLSPIPLHIDISDTSDDFISGQPLYTDLLIGYLHQSLHLPDFGEVKIQLTLRQDGSVAKMTVLHSESEKNRSYLESNLRRMRFPHFDAELARQSEHTFTFTFCNEL